MLYEIVEWDGFRRYFWLDKSYYAEKDSSCYTEKKVHFCTKIDPRLIWEGMPVDYFFFEMVGYTVTNLKKTFFFSPVTWWACAVCYLLKARRRNNGKNSWFWVRPTVDGLLRTLNQLQKVRTGNCEVRIVEVQKWFERKMCVRQKKRKNVPDAFDGEAKNWFKGHLLPLRTENKYYLRRSLFLK